MESTDVFAGGTEIGEDDPFAGTDFGDFERQPEPVAPPEPERPVIEAPDATAGLPTVDREGNPVEAPVQTPPPGPTDPEADAAAYAERNAPPEAPEPTTEPQVGPTPEAQAALDSLKPPSDQQPVAADAGPETTGPPPGDATVAPEPAAAPAESAGPTETPPPTPAGGPDPTAAPSAATDAGKSTSESAGADDTPPVDEGDAPPPKELKDKSGRTTHRRYLILKVLGNGKYEIVTWHVNGKGQMVPKGTSGAKRQRYALCRGQEDALKIGYAALGSPPRTTIVAVALSSFQERTVEPEPPKPERARLKIS